MTERMSVEKALQGIQESDDGLYVAAGINHRFVDCEDFGP